MYLDEELDELKRWASKFPLGPADVRELLAEIDRLRKFEALAKETGIFG